MSKYCTKCGQLLSDESLFCNACGTKQEKAEAVNSTPATMNNNFLYEKPAISSSAIGKDKIISIVKSGLIALLSVIILIFSFLPIVSIKYEYQKEDINVTVNAIDCASIMFYSFNSLSTEEIEESDLYYKNQEILQELRDEIEYSEKFTDEANNLVNKYVKNIAYLAVMNEDYTDLLPTIAIGSVSIVYIVFAITTFILSILKLLSTIGVLKKDAIKNLALRFSIITLCICLLISTIATSTLRIPTFETSVGYGSLTIIILASIVYLALMLLNVIFKLYEKKINLPLKFVSIAFAITLILLSTSPILTANVKTIFSGKDTKRELSINVYQDVYKDLIIENDDKETIYEIIDLSKEEKREYFEQMLNAYSYFTTYQIKEGLADSVTSNLTTTLLKVKANEFIRVLLSTYQIISNLGVIFALFILYENLICLTLGKYAHFILILSKILTLITSFVSLTMNVILLITLNSITDTYLSGLSYSLGAGTIIMAIIALTAIFTPTRTKAEKPVKKMVFETITNA